MKKFLFIIAGIAVFSFGIYFLVWGKKGVDAGAVAASAQTASSGNHAVGQVSQLPPRSSHSTRTS